MRAPAVGNALPAIVEFCGASWFKAFKSGARMLKMNWGVEQFQLALFHTPNAAHDAYQTWLSLFQATPDNYQRHPDPLQRASQAGGLAFGYNWLVQVAPGRTDVFLSAANTNGTGSPVEAFPLVGNDSAASSLLMQRLSLMQVEQIGVLRIALVSQFTFHVQSSQEANERFFALTGIAKVEPTVSDLIYSLNCRKKLDRTGILANRLCRWQTVEKQFVTMQVGAVNEFMPAITQPAVALNVDINTVPQQVPFKASEVPLIAADLLVESVRIRNGGYNALIS